MKSENVRPAAVANMFYPGNAEMLRQKILDYLQKADSSNVKGKIKALIVPHAGYIFSGQVAADAYKLLKDLDRDIDWKILLMGPSHYIPFSGAAATTFEKWETPLGQVNVNDIRDEIGEKDSIINVPDAGDQEHSLEVQVPFLQMTLNKFKLYPLVLGDIKPEIFADDILEFCKKDDVILIVSSDLSHFLEYEEAKKVDLATSEAVCNLDMNKMIEAGDACGKMAILTLLHIAGKLDWKCKMLEY
ncbi:AmmeMemoRadiSam system protein B, partial [Candidatus Peregrinibacteria bacterium]|nr:AmmeMemoRadiSam system protein B [Candidatus Peregrinibacteria bacterium]